MGKMINFGSKRNRARRHHHEPSLKTLIKHQAIEAKGGTVINPRNRPPSKPAARLGKFGPASEVRRIDPKTGEPFK